MSFPNVSTDNIYKFFTTILIIGIASGIVFIYQSSLSADENISSLYLEIDLLNVENQFIQE